MLNLVNRIFLHVRPLAQRQDNTACPWHCSPAARSQTPWKDPSQEPVSQRGVQVGDSTVTPCLQTWHVSQGRLPPCPSSPVGERRCCECPGEWTVSARVVLIA